MQIEERKTAELVDYANNARTHTEEHIKQIAASIREFGWTNPVLVDAAGMIIAGHGRVMAARHLGLETVPTVCLDHLTDEQKRAYVLADNQLALNAGWDEDLLKVELAALEDCGFDLSLIGFDAEELAGLLGLDGAGGEDDAYTKKIVAPTYEPDGEKPDLAELVDMEKTTELLREIEASTLPDEEKAFLRLAAARLMVFDYHRIADYYAHSSEGMQALMERLALVIIDFDKAIENGYVKLTADLSEIFSEATGDDAA